MKKPIIPLLLSFALLLVPLHADEEKKQPLDALLRDALFAEAADRDLAKAEKGYREIIERFDGNRAYAATALLRLAEMLDKRGEKAEAEKLFARVVQEFPDQEAVAKVARVRLGDKAPSAVSVGSPEATPAALPEQQELARLKKLLAESPDLLNAPSGAGVTKLTPLANAAGKGYMEVVEYLLEQGANIDGNSGSRPRPGKASADTAPLYRAAKAGKIEIAKRLLESGAKVDDSFLPDVIKTGNFAATQLLLEAGADPNHMYRLDLSPDLGRSSWVQPTSKNGIWNGNFSCLDVAMYHDFEKLTNLLIEHGAKPISDAGDSSHETRLATIAGDKASVVEFLKQGADPNASWNGSSLLHIAAANGREEITKLLLEAGAKIATYKNGNTPLHEATGAVIGVLIAAGADVNASNQDGNRPLHNAFRVEDVKTLIAAGADLNARNGRNMTAVESAAAHYDEILDVFLAIPDGVDLSASGPNGTLLGFAAEQGNVNSIKKLIKAGADPDLADLQGRTPLHRGIRALDVEVVKALLEAGADPEGKGSPMPPLTALSTDSTRNQNWLSTIRTLVDAGANVDAVDGGGRTALTKSTLRADLAAVTYLLGKGASPMASAVPAFEESPPNKNFAKAIRSKLFLAAYLEPELRKGVLRFGNPEKGDLWTTVRPVMESGAEIPDCPHTLLEAYSYLTNYKPVIGNVTIWRDGQVDPIFKDLREMISKRDPAADFPLQWGDVIEMQKSNGAEGGISEEDTKFLASYLKRSVKVTAVGDKHSHTIAVEFTAGEWDLNERSQRWMPQYKESIVPLTPEKPTYPHLTPLGKICWLTSFSQGRPSIRTVTRSIDGKPVKIEVASKSKAPEIWLEDGDAIELKGGISVAKPSEEKTKSNSIFGESDSGDSPFGE